MNGRLYGKLSKKCENLLTAYFSGVFCNEKNFSIILSCLVYSEMQFGIFCLCGLGNTVSNKEMRTFSRIRARESTTGILQYPQGGTGLFGLAD